MNRTWGKPEVSRKSRPQHQISVHLDCGTSQSILAVMSEEQATTTSISSTRSGGERCSDGISKLYCGMVALFALYVMWLAIDAHYTFPHHDDWRILDNFFSTPLLEFLAKSQNGHRVPFTLFLLHLDYTHFGGHMNLLVLGSVVCTGIGVMVLVTTYWIADRAHTPLARAGYGFACFLFCWAASRHDLVWGMNDVGLAAIGTGLGHRRRSLDAIVTGLGHERRGIRCHRHWHEAEKMRDKLP